MYRKYKLMIHPLFASNNKEPSLATPFSFFIIRGLIDVENGNGF